MVDCESATETVSESSSSLGISPEGGESLACSRHVARLDIATRSNSTIAAAATAASATTAAVVAVSRLERDDIAEPFRVEIRKSHKFFFWVCDTLCYERQAPGEACLCLMQEAPAVRDGRVCVQKHLLSLLHRPGGTRMSL
jgi:hypothetical protein